jgi:hypothetical protein
MQPHPDFAGRMLPRSADLGLFHLAPLGPCFTEEDFAAVTRSAPVLQGIFGSDWPMGLTLEENGVDLAWHEREFTSCRSFAWILRGSDGVYLGCAYVYPNLGERGRGRINLWLVDSPDRLAKLAAFQPALAAWLQPWLPPGSHYDWQVNDRGQPT